MEWNSLVLCQRRQFLGTHAQSSEWCLPSRGRLHKHSHVRERSIFERCADPFGCKHLFQPQECRANDYRCRLGAYRLQYRRRIHTSVARAKPLFHSCGICTLFSNICRYCFSFSPAASFRVSAPLTTGSRADVPAFGGYAPLT